MDFIITDFLIKIITILINLGTIFFGTKETHYRKHILLQHILLFEFNTLQWPFGKIFTLLQT